VHLAGFIIRTEDDLKVMYPIIPHNCSHLFVCVCVCVCVVPKFCSETELGSLAIIFHVKWQPLLQYTVTWETERHFVFLPTIQIKGARCVQVYVRVWHLMI